MDEFDEAPEKELPPPDETQPPEAPEKDSPDGETGSTAVEQDRVKNAQRKMHEAAQKAAAAEKELAELRGKVDALMHLQRAPEEQARNPFDFLDTPEFVESLYDDPKNAIRAFKEVIGVFGETLRAQEEAFNQRLNERVKIIDPEYQAVKGKVAELRKNPKLANLPEEYLVEVAKEMAGKDTDTSDAFRGSLPSSGRRPSSKETDARREDGINYFMRKFGYDRFDKE